VAALPLLSTSLVPAFKDRDVLVRLDAEPGTSHPRMTEIATAVSRALRSLPGVDNVGAHVGRAVTGDQRVDVNSAEVWVSIGSGADRDATLGRIEQVVAGVPEVERDVETYSTQRIRDVGALIQGDNRAAGGGMDLLTGSDEPLVARIYGQDLDVLQREADRVRGLMASVEGVQEPRVELPRRQPNLVIEVDLAKAQRFGIKPGDVRRSEAALLQGIHVGSVFDDQKVFDVLVTGVPETREGIADVRNLLIDRPDGGHVRLGQVADVRIEPAPVAIDREAVSRYIDVEAGVGGRSLDAVAADLRSRLAGLAFPLEYHTEVLERTAGAEIGVATVVAFGLVCAVASLLLLQAAFRSWSLAALALLLLPVALLGGVLAVLIGGGTLSLGSTIAFIGLLGIAARTSVLSIRQMQRGDGAQERLGPVLTTAAAVALLMLPLAALGARPGLEVVHPMAVVMLGGLVSTTLVSLFLLPALYGRIGDGGLPADLEWEGVLVTQFAGIGPANGGGGVPTGGVPAHESER
jgi:Cu/Ag efflux pump CusA